MTIREFGLDDSYTQWLLEHIPVKILDMEYDGISVSFYLGKVIIYIK